MPDLFDFLRRLKDVSGKVTPSRREQHPEWIVVGLGNPGERYARTRHNVGFWCVERLAQDHAISFTQRRPLALIGAGEISGKPLVLCKPRSYMNNSGEALHYLKTRYRASPQHLLVIYDDLDLPLGRVRIRLSGSAGGHRGVDSIIEKLGITDFPRIRVGIGRPPEDTDTIQYVLEQFSSDEHPVIDHSITLVSEAVAYLLAHGIERAMNEYNSRSPS